MSAVYFSASEWIKKKNYEVHAPAYYHPFMPKEMLNPVQTPLPVVNRFKMVPTQRRSTQPFYTHPDPARMQRASYSVEVMLDMFQKKIAFEIAFESDLPEILENVDWYLNSLKPDVETGNEYAVEYATVVIRWREEVFKHYYRYMMTHETSLAQLYPNGKKTENLLYLMSNLGVRKEDLELDPLRAKAKPPYTIESMRPKTVEERHEDSLEKSYGISAEDLLKDDGKDFDFDAFTKRS